MEKSNVLNHLKQAKDNNLKSHIFTQSDSSQQPETYVVIDFKEVDDEYIELFAERGGSLKVPYASITEILTDDKKPRYPHL